MTELNFGKLGFYNLAAVQLSLVITSLFSTSIINKVGIRISHCCGTLGVGIWVLSSVLPAMKKQALESESWVYSEGFIYFVSILGSSLCGIGAGILWTVQGFYVSICSSDESRGLYFGLFWIFYTSSQVFGNLIAAFVLGSLDEEVFFLIMTVIAFSSIFLFATLRKPKPLKNESFQATTTSLKSIGASGEIGLLQANSTTELSYRKENQNTSEEEKAMTTIQMTIAMIKCLTSEKMRLLLPQISWSGMSMGYYSGMLVLIMSSVLAEEGYDASDQYKLPLLAMVAFGVGELSGGMLAGYVTDKFSSKSGVLLNLGIVLLMSLFTTLFISVYQFNWVAFGMSFLWGLQDGSMNTHALSILSTEFNDSVEPFAVFCCMQGFLCFVIQMIQSFLQYDQQTYLLYSIVICVLAFFGCGTTYFFEFKSNNQSKLVPQLLEEDTLSESSFHQEESFNK